MNDAQTAAWVLIAGTVLIGVWYWRLRGDVKRAKLGRPGEPPGFRDGEPYPYPGGPGMLDPYPVLPGDIERRLIGGPLLGRN